MATSTFYEQVRNLSKQDRDAFWAKHVCDFGWRQTPCGEAVRRHSQQPVRDSMVRKTTNIDKVYIFHNGKWVRKKTECVDSWRVNRRKFARFEKPPKVLWVRRDPVRRDNWEWFPEGRVSTCFNCVDRHVLAGRGDKVAIDYRCPRMGFSETWTYDRLLDEVMAMAGSLRKNIVLEGDVVLVYMPPIPQAIAAVLAINRIGAIACVVTGGTPAAELADRIDSSKPVVMVTASCGIREAQLVPWCKLVNDALLLAHHKPMEVLVWERPEEGPESQWWQNEWLNEWHRSDSSSSSSNTDSDDNDDDDDNDNGNMIRGNNNKICRSMGAAYESWNKLLRKVRLRGCQVTECVSLASDAPVYVLHTPGTTGHAKLVARASGGHAVGLSLSMRSLLGVTGPDHVVLTAAELGSITGLSYMVYGPLLMGATTVLYEGRLQGAHDATPFWEVVKTTGVDTLVVTPTALKAVTSTPLLAQTLCSKANYIGLRYALVTGGRAESGLVAAFRAFLTRVCNRPNFEVAVAWCSVESGTPMASRKINKPSDARSGCVGKPLPGFDVRVVDNKGAELPSGACGNLVLALPLGPSACDNYWDDEVRFYNTYLRRFAGRWFDTGDKGFVDHDGHIQIKARGHDDDDDGDDDVHPVRAFRSMRCYAVETRLLYNEAIKIDNCIVVDLLGAATPDYLRDRLPLAVVMLPDSDAEFLPCETEVEEQERLASTLSKITTVGSVIPVIAPFRQFPDVLAAMLSDEWTAGGLQRALCAVLDQASRGIFEADIHESITVNNFYVVRYVRETLRRYYDDAHRPRPTTPS